MKPETAAHVLSWVLIVVGGMGALAIVPMVMPTDWMVAANDHMGLGPFPRSTLMEYLTRSASALYAMVGVLLVYIGFHVRIYLKLISFVGCAGGSASRTTQLEMLSPSVSVPMSTTSSADAITSPSRPSFMSSTVAVNTSPSRLTAI